MACAAKWVLSRCKLSRSIGQHELACMVLVEQQMRHELPRLVPCCSCLQERWAVRGSAYGISSMLNASQTNPFMVCVDSVQIASRHIATAAPCNVCN
jgi:hypothetical protein